MMVKLYLRKLKTISIMKTSLLSFILLFSCLSMVSQTVPLSLDYHPQASEDAIVICGNARFTVLTSRLVRMEWSADQKFEDRATLGVVNRNLDVPMFSVKKSKSKVVIKTDDITLTYSFFFKGVSYLVSFFIELFVAFKLIKDCWSSG